MAVHKKMRTSCKSYHPVERYHALLMVTSCDNESYCHGNAYRVETVGQDGCRCHCYYEYSGEFCETLRQCRWGEYSSTGKYPCDTCTFYCSPGEIRISFCTSTKDTVCGLPKEDCADDPKHIAECNHVSQNPSWCNDSEDVKLTCPRTCKVCKNTYRYISARHHIGCQNGGNRGYIGEPAEDYGIAKDKKCEFVKLLNKYGKGCSIDLSKACKGGSNYNPQTMLCGGACSAACISVCKKSCDKSSACRAFAIHERYGPQMYDQKGIACSSPNGLAPNHWWNAYIKDLNS